MKENIITEYILKQDKISHEYLWEVYKILDSSIGDKTTKILSYQIPTFKARKNIIHFAAYKNHIGIYPGSQTIEKFKDDLKGYTCSKGTLQIKYDQEIPKELIKKMALYSYQMNNK